MSLSRGQAASPSHTALVATPIPQSQETRLQSQLPLALCSLGALGRVRGRDTRLPIPTDRHSPYGLQIKTKGTEYNLMAAFSILEKAGNQGRSLPGATRAG